MPRLARLHAPGAVVHVITRFVDRQFRLVGPLERSTYLELLGRAMARSDWCLVAYALMSSHVHLALLAGADPPWVLLRRLNTAVALALNRLHARFGPVVAERATTLVVPPARAGELVAYLHNNPCRAGLVRVASESDWTSHRCWLGIADVPSFLDVPAGLRLAGFAATVAGRSEFDGFVNARCGRPRDRALSQADARDTWRRCRGELGLPIELASGVLQPDGTVETTVLSSTSVAPRWSGDMETVARAVAEVTGVTVEELQSPRCARRITAARRVLAVVSVMGLRRRPGEVAGVLAVSASAVSRMLCDSARAAPVASKVLRALGR